VGVLVMYAEELNSGESSATLWSTRPTWDFGRKVCGFSILFGPNIAKLL
jgi:hypothetical protein